MADYYPLLARAISALPGNSGEARRVVYERARSALLAQLRGADPALPESDIARERQALDDAVRRLEAEYGDAPSSAAPLSAGTASAAPMPPAAPPGSAPVPSAAVTPPPPAAASPMPPTGRVAVPLPGRPPAPRPFPERPAADRPAAEPPIPGLTSSRGEPSPFADPAPAAPRGDVRARPDSYPMPESRARHAEPRGADTREPPAGRARAPVEPDEDEDEAGKGGGRRWGRLVALLLLFAAICGAIAVGYVQRDTIVAMIRDFRASTSSPAPATTPVATPDVPKSTDRIAQAPNDPSRRVESPSPAAGGPVAAVAQRAVLFEENPGGQQGLQQYVGTVLWSTETFRPADGLPPDTGIRAVVSIPDREMKVDISLRRNQDASLPASHIIELQFDLPANFALGSVASIPGMRAKASEAAQGVPLSGLAVRVTPTFFLIGLSALDAERNRNLGLLVTRNWLDLPIVFGNGRRGILVVEKGLPGDKAFRDAYTAWGLPLPPAQGTQQ